MYQSIYLYYKIPKVTYHGIDDEHTEILPTQQNSKNIIINKNPLIFFISTMFEKTINAEACVLMSDIS